MKTLLTLFIILITLNLSAQSIERQVIGSLGNTFTSSNLIVTSTVGEVAVATNSNANIMLTEGYQQAIVTVPSSINGLSNFSKLALFPNPTTDIATLDIKANISLSTMVRVLSAEGKLIKQISTQIEPGVSSSVLLDMTAEASGVYLIHITSAQEGFSEVMRLVKQ